MKKVLFAIATLLTFLAIKGAWVTGVRNLSELAAFNPLNLHSNVFVAGTTTPGDGGGGIFVYKTTTAVTNPDSIIASTYSTGFWHRVVPNTITVTNSDGSGATYVTTYITTNINQFITTNVITSVTNLFQNITNISIQNIIANNLSRPSCVITGATPLVNWTNCFLDRLILTTNTSPIMVGVPIDTNVPTHEVDVVQELGAAYTLTWGDDIYWPNGTNILVLPENSTNKFVFQWNGEALVGRLVDGSSSGISGLTSGYIPYATSPTALGDSPLRRVSSSTIGITPGDRLSWNGTTNTVIATAGTGSPEGVLTADIGSFFTQFDGSTNGAVAFKSDGAGNTGWNYVVGGPITGLSAGWYPRASGGATVDNSNIYDVLDDTFIGNYIKFDRTMNFDFEAYGGRPSIQFTNNYRITDQGNGLSFLKSGSYAAMYLGEHTILYQDYNVGAQLDNQGLLLVNSTSATGALGQNAPAITLTGAGWSTATNQSYFVIANLNWVVQSNTPLPSAELKLRTHIGDGVMTPAMTNSITLGSAGYIKLEGPNGGSVGWFHGTGTPEGNITANVGSIYSRDDGGAGTSFYVKESGSGNTGWVAK